MSDLSLGVSDVCPMRSVKKSFHNAKGQMLKELTFKAPKGQKFMMLMVGIVDEGTEQEFDANAALESLGWKFAGDDPVVAEDKGGKLTVRE